MYSIKKKLEEALFNILELYHLFFSLTVRKLLSLSQSPCKTNNMASLTTLFYAFPFILVDTLVTHQHVICKHESPQRLLSNFICQTVLHHREQEGAQS